MWPPGPGGPLLCPIDVLSAPKGSPRDLLGREEEERGTGLYRARYKVLFGYLPVEEEGISNSFGSRKEEERGTGLYRTQYKVLFAYFFFQEKVG